MPIVFVSCIYMLSLPACRGSRDTLKAFKIQNSFLISSTYMCSLFWLIAEVFTHKLKIIVRLKV